MNELTLACIRAIYARRRLLLLVLVLATCLSVVRVVFFTKGSFYAEAILVASTGKKEFMPDTLNPQIYNELVSSRTVLYETYQAVIEQKILPEDEIPEFDDFAGMFEAEVTVVDQTTRPVNYSPLVTLRAWSYEPKLAQAIVDIWAEKAMKTAQRANYLQIGELATSLDKQAAARKKTLDNLWEALEKDKVEFNIDAKQEELGRLLSLMRALLDDKSSNERDLAAAKAQLASAQEKLASEKPFIELFRAPSDETYWLLEKEEGKSAKNPVDGKGMITQQLNTVYLALRTNENEAAARIAVAEAQLQEIQAQLDTIIKEQEVLHAEISEHVLIRQRLTSQEGLANTIYNNLAATQALLAETANVVQGDEQRSDYAVGLNRLSNLSPVKDDLSLKAKIMVVAYTFLAVVMAVGLVLAPVVGKRVLGEMK